ncbi:SAM-dependent methyltransferase [Qipengyuania atrilutea]|uniref:Class I SAM-dependent methyltransferase n=1 Tax=Qipengyuania atrilutea TaxID=2744473 RepID=A0A850H005_9SPHN|nr:cyclopropane-fatty-acyl-phospholipid synthase family protein [Actirhodobacter atriluteus]NVD44056.1 class I SAM-dependent methyltransferase [Actirhodobacter atriluteus]
MFDKLLDRVLQSHIKRGVLEIVHADGREVRCGAPDPQFGNVRIRFTDTRVARDIVRDQSLGAGEAYMDGRLVLERGEIMELVEIVKGNGAWEVKRPVRRGLTGKLKLALKARLAEANRQTSARSNVSHHYDIGNDLYRMFLDSEHLQYSCAYWPEDDMTLGEAQTAKLAHIAAKLAIEPGQEVLDIGCGWGGMAIYLARHFDCRVLGITLSTEQRDLAIERAEAAGVSDKVSFELVDYRDLAAYNLKFDRIVSVGMFEHVGRPQFDTFFDCCARLLTGDGVILLHTIGRMGVPGATDAFTRKYIFPGGYIPALSEIVSASEPYRLIATDVETMRLHYARTLRAWYANCAANREAIVSLYDERFYRMWMFYLSGATASFEHGGMCNYQVQYARNRYALPLTRDYMREAELGLLKA